MSITFEVLHLQFYIQVISLFKTELLPCDTNERLKLLIFVDIGESFLFELTNYIFCKDVELFNLLVCAISEQLVFFVPLFTLRYCLNQEF